MVNLNIQIFYCIFQVIYVIFEGRHSHPGWSHPDRLSSWTHLVYVLMMRLMMNKPSMGEEATGLILLHGNRPPTFFVSPSFPLFVNRLWFIFNLAKNASCLN